MAMLYLTRMQKAIRKTQAKEKALREREARLKSENGQAMLEFFFASLVGIVLILGIFQITLIYNARSLVKLAAFNAARAAIVARADSSPTSEDAVDLDLMQKRAKRAAFLTILPVIPAIQGRLDPDPQKRPLVAKNLLIFAKTLQTLAWTAGPTLPVRPRIWRLSAAFFGRAAVALYESIGVTIDDDLNLVDCLDVQSVDPTADLDDDKAIKKAIIKKWPEEDRVRRSEGRLRRQPHQSAGDLALPAGHPVRQSDHHGDCPPEALQDRSQPRGLLRHRGRHAEEAPRHEQDDPRLGDGLRVLASGLRDVRLEWRRREPSRPCFPASRSYRPNTRPRRGTLPRPTRVEARRSSFRSRETTASGNRSASS